MTFRYPKRLAYLLFGVVLAFQISPFAGNNLIQPIAWLMIESFIIVVLLYAIHVFKFSCLVDDNYMVVSAFKQSKYALDDIISIEVAIGKGVRFAVVKFKDGRKVSFPNYLKDFKPFVALLRQKTGLPKPKWEEDFR